MSATPRKRAAEGGDRDRGGQLELHRFEGDAHERGRHYGVHCMGANARLSQAALAEMRAKRSALDRRGRRRLMGARAAVYALAPELHEEMAGIAAGAGEPFDDILDLNARNAWTEPGQAVGGCTAVAIRNGGQTVFFKTLDDALTGTVDEPARLAKIAKMLAEVTLADYRSARGERVHFYRQSSLFLGGDIGMNSAGLATGQTSLHPGLIPSPMDGLPHVLLPPLILERCASVADARGLLAGITLASPKGYTVTLADHGGEIASFDCTTRGCYEVEPTKDVAFATNHLRDEQLQLAPADEKRPFPNATYEANSVRRYKSLLALRERAPDGSWEWWAERLLSPQGDNPFIQRGGELHSRWLTIWAALLEPGAGRWRMTSGLPERFQFTSFSLPRATPHAVSSPKR